MELKTIFRLVACVVITYVFAMILGGSPYPREWHEHVRNTASFIFISSVIFVVLWGLVEYD